MKHRRTEFTADTKRQAHARANGICECHRIGHVFAQSCGRPLGDGNTFYEHVDPDRISGRNDLDNCAVLTKTCWKIKTACYDAQVIARVRRREDRARGIRPQPTLPGARKDPFKIKIAHRKLVDRATGEPWRPRG